MARVLQAEGVRKAHKEKRLRRDDSVAVDRERNGKRRKKVHGECHKQLEIKVRLSQAVHSPRNALTWNVFTYGSMAKALHIIVGE